MKSIDRRAFLNSSLGGLAAWSVTAPLFGKEEATSKTPTTTTPAVKKPEPTPIVASHTTANELDSLFLTWRRDPTTTMVVQWVGRGSKETVKLEYAVKAEEAEWQSATVKQKPYPMTEWVVYRTELSNLTPGTEYQFRIGAAPKVYRFRTMPAKATDTFSFVSGGDCGVGQHAIANNILAAKQNPMFALIGGDLGYDNGKSADISLAFIRNYGKHMIDAQGRLVPMVVCMGNHEVNGGYGGTREKAPFFFALHDGLYDENSYATLDFGDYLSLVLLDSGHVSKIDGEQTSWLDIALEERTERDHLIAVNHVPSYPSYRAPDTATTSSKTTAGTGVLSRKHWVPLFEKHNVDCVLEHHDHTFKRTRPLKEGLINDNGIVYLGDGSWGKLRVPKKSEVRPYLAKTSEAYHMTVHYLEGKERFHVALEDTGRIVDVYRTVKRPRRTVGRSAT